MVKKEYKTKGAVRKHSSTASKQDSTWHSCTATPKSLSGQPNPDLIERLARKEFGGRRTAISCGSSFRSSWWQSCHSAFSFFLHLFTILILLYEKCVTSVVHVPLQSLNFRLLLTIFIFKIRKKISIVFDDFKIVKYDFKIIFSIFLRIQIRESSKTIVIYHFKYVKDDFKNVKYDFKYVKYKFRFWTRKSSKKIVIYIFYKRYMDNS